jgi:carboxyl-terminal processing protease
MLIDTSFLNTNLNKLQSLKSYMKITGGKFYRVTGESHQAKGIVPDIVLPGIIEQVMEKEIDYQYHLTCDSVNKKVNYSKLDELPRDQLTQLSNKRISGNKNFTEIKNTGDSLAVAKTIDEKIALNLGYFKKYSEKQMNFNLKIGNLFTGTNNNTIEITNNTANQKVVSMSEYQTRNNENAIGSLKKDLILHECIYILNGLVLISKNNPK